jgi:hypothetical protein
MGNPLREAPRSEARASDSASDDEDDDDDDDEEEEDELFLLAPRAVVRLRGDIPLRAAVRVLRARGDMSEEVDVDDDADGVMCGDEEEEEEEADDDCMLLFGLGTDWEKPPRPPLSSPAERGLDEVRVEGGGRRARGEEDERGEPRKAMEEEEAEAALLLGDPRVSWEEEEVGVGGMMLAAAA